jgi:hypothetical protein
MATKVRVREDATVLVNGCDKPSIFRGRTGVATGQHPWSDYEVVVAIDGANVGFMWSELEPVAEQALVLRDTRGRKLA